MSRGIACALLVVAVLPAVQIRVSREPTSSEPPPPALWETAHPPGRYSAPPVVTRSERGLTVTYPSPSINCPILISTDPESQYTLTAAEDGVLFDIDADGDLDQVAWTERTTDVAFLALDRDGDGQVTSGRELIGDSTLPGVVNGPNALMQLVADAGGLTALDSRTPLFTKMHLWRDANHNGRSEPIELRPAGEELSTIGLGFQRHPRVDPHGNQSRFRGFVHIRTAPGLNRAATPEDDRARRRYMYDVCLVVQ